MRMYSPRGVVVVVVAAVAVVVAGCSSPNTGQPSPTSSDPASTSSASGGTTAHGAPRVANPLSVTAFEQNPCSMLTAAQLQQLGMTVHGKDTSSAVAWSCDWFDEFGPTGTDIGPGLLKGGGGLDAVYANRRSLQLFQPIADIDGYPALLADTLDARSNGKCGVDVGVRDDVALGVVIQMRGGSNPAPNYAKPCDVAEEVAQAIVDTLKNGGS